jgi:hypothetical protein
LHSRGHDLEGRLGLDRFDEVEDLVVHFIVDRVDRRMIERHTPVARRLLVGADPGRHVFHFVSFATALDPGGCNCRDRSNGRFRGTSPFAKRRGATLLAIAIVG